MKKSHMTYKASGLDYASLDPFKKAGMAMAAKTELFMRKRGFEILPWSRGESAFVFRHIKTGLLQAMVIEGLGTANVAAEDKKLRMQFKRTFYDSAAVSNVAMAENDLITVGALPYLYGLHISMEDGSHLKGANGDDILKGTFQALKSSGATLGPGETSGLRDIIVPGTLSLSGATLGVFTDEKYLMNSQNVQPGLRIVMLASTGIHANGYTLARRIAGKLRKGYLTDIGNGVMYGEALLQPTRIYVEFTERCQEANIPLVYAVNITGHGWRKLMRARKELRYVVEQTPPISPLFQFMMAKGPVKIREMFGNLNMGAGYAVFVRPKHAPRVIAEAETIGIPAWDAGYVEEGPRSVVIKPFGLTFKELDLR